MTLKKKKKIPSTQRLRLNYIFTLGSGHRQSQWLFQIIFISHAIKMSSSTMYSWCVYCILFILWSVTVWNFLPLGHLIALWNDIENSRILAIKTLYTGMYPLDVELIEYSLWFTNEIKSMGE